MSALTPNHYRREAELVEQAAAAVSLQSDKEQLWATARSLRLRADAMEPPLDGGQSFAQTEWEPGDTV